MLNNAKIQNISLIQINELKKFQIAFCFYCYFC